LWQVRPCSSAALVKQVLARPERLDPAGDPDAGQRNLRTATAARYLALLHEPGAARRIANLGAGRAVMPTAQANWAEARIEAARQLEDWPDVLAQLELRQAIDFEPTLLFEAYAALAHAKLGNSPAAWAVEARLPADCYRCQYVLAMAHEAMGDRTGADRRFAEAARQGPSLAWAETEWARVFVARGDAKAAIVQAKRAQKKAPKWADPLEAWGEALLMQGDAEGAASKFALAQKLTPRWGRLHLKWGEALAAQGEMDEARAKWRAAAGMDLSPGDRSRLESLLRQRTT
jgi:tetratricopeptide (TPR) repeat protein